MPKISYKKKKEKPQSHYFYRDKFFYLGGFVASLILVLLYFAIIFFNKNELRTLTYPLETTKTEIHTLPPQAKKKLQNVPLEQTLHVPILMYHYVEYVQDKKDTIRQSLDVTPFIFEQQVKTLKDAGYTFMTARELGEVLDGKIPLPPKPVLITFDDGHWDLYTDILPILQKYNVQATAYIIPGFLNGSDFLTTHELQMVATSGLVEIGAHTIHHLALKKLPLKTVQQEVAGSKSMLEDIIHTPVVSFAYPYGSFDEQAENVVKDSGFETAVSTVPGIEVTQVNRYFLFRLRPGYRTGQDLLNYLQNTKFTPSPNMD